jgi:hypothetical protein
MYTIAEPLSDKSDPVLEDVRVLDIVVPEEVYTPVPISHATPSSIT